MSRDLFLALNALRLEHGDGAIPQWQGKVAVKVEHHEFVLRGHKCFTTFYHLTDDARQALRNASLLPWGG